MPLTRIQTAALQSSITGSNITDGSILAADLITTSDFTFNGIRVGRGAGAVATNTAVGASALAANTSGTHSTAVGLSALQANSSGTYNTAVGLQALLSNTTGATNSAFGFNSLSANTTGANNVAVGVQALTTNTTASYNTAVGYQAGYTNVTGATVTYLGYQAGYTATGGNNTFVGTQAGYSVTTGAKNTILGRYDGNQGGLDIRTASNYIVLSDGDGNPRQVIDSSGNVGIGTASASQKLEVAGNILINTSGNPSMTVKTSGAGNNPSYRLQADTTYWDIGASFSDATDPLTFGYGGTERARIDSSGNVGIGTSSPSYKLDVQGSVGATIASKTAEFNAAGASIYSSFNDGTKTWRIGVGIQTSGMFTFRNHTDGTVPVNIDSSGNVGIGTSSPGAKLHVQGTDVAFTANTLFDMAIIENGASGNGAVLQIVAATDGSSEIGFSDTTRNIGKIGYNHSTNAMVFDTNSSERARIDSSGNVGIGTTSITPRDSGARTLELFGTSSGRTAIKFTNSTSGTGATDGMFLGYDDNLNFSIYNNESGVISLGTSNTERARFNSGGEFSIGKTSPSEGAQTGSGFGFASPAVDPFFSVVNANASGLNACIYLNRRTTGALILFGTNNGSGFSAVGSISHNGSNTAYNTSSDYRLKENIAPMTGALAKVALLKPCTYKWNADGSDGEGFIAHELAEVCPHAVTGEKDAIDENGNIKPQGIDASFLVATLTAAIQEQQALITQLTARIAALEST